MWYLRHKLFKELRTWYMGSMLSLQISVSLFVCVLCHINFCGPFNAKSIFIQINSSISNNSVLPKSTVSSSKTFLFQVMQFSQTVLIQTTQFSISIVFVQTQLDVKTVLFQTIQFNVSTVSMSKTVPFQTIHFSISVQFKCQNSSISKSSVKLKYAA